MSESVHDQAEAAINSLGGLDSALGSQDAPVTSPEPAPQQQVPPAEQQPYWANQPRTEQGQWASPEQAQASPEGPAVQPDTSFMGEGFDPNTLPPELQQRYLEMQQHFTRRNQEAAEIRRQYEGLGDPQEIQAALELRESLQDPRNWVQLHSELSDELQAMGYSVAQADVEASRQMQDHIDASPQLPQLPESDDPDLQPYRQHIESLNQELNSVKSQFDEWRAEQEAQQMELALVGEVTRQVNAIREARPDYSENDINAIYEIASFYDGDLFAAQNRYEEILQDRISRYMQSKQQTAPQQQPLPGAGVTTQVPRVATWDDARASALQIAAQMDGQ